MSPVFLLRLTSSRSSTQLCSIFWGLSRQVGDFDSLTLPRLCGANPLSFFPPCPVINKSPRRFRHMVNSALSCSRRIHSEDGTPQFPSVLTAMIGSTIPIAILGSRFAMSMEQFWKPIQFSASLRILYTLPVCSPTTFFSQFLLSGCFAGRPFRESLSPSASS